MTAPSVIVPAAAFLALDAAYRAAIAKTALSVAHLMLIEWQRVQARNLVGTAPAWLQRAVELTIAGQRQAQGFADAYTTMIRHASVPGAPPWSPVQHVEPNLDQLYKSLEFTGVKTTARELARLEENIKSGKLGEEPDYESLQRTEQGRQRQLMDDAINRAAAATVRHITTAGQEQVMANIVNDKVALGWYRTTKAACCFFCAMLASRGAVYKEDSFADSDPRFTGPGDAKVHDHCGCGIRPIYSVDDPKPDQVDKFEKLWIKMGDEKDPRDSDIIAFRRLYEGRKRPEAKLIAA